MNFYISKMVIPGLKCACMDSPKGTKKLKYAWLSNKWTINGKTGLKEYDLENEKYFEKIE